MAYLVRTTLSIIGDIAERALADQESICLLPGANGHYCSVPGNLPPDRWQSTYQFKGRSAKSQEQYRVCFVTPATSFGGKNSVALDNAGMVHGI
jgi:hypothetical protein